MSLLHLIALLYIVFLSSIIDILLLTIPGKTFSFYFLQSRSEMLSAMSLTQISNFKVTHHRRDTQRIVLLDIDIQSVIPAERAHQQGSERRPHCDTPSTPRGDHSATVGGPTHFGHCTWTPRVIFASQEAVVRHFQASRAFVHVIHHTF